MDVTLEIIYIFKQLDLCYFKLNVKSFFYYIFYKFIKEKNCYFRLNLHILRSSFKTNKI